MAGGGPAAQRPGPSVAEVLRLGLVVAPPKLSTHQRAAGLSHPGPGRAPVSV
jgi:hypothetical protein